MVFFCHELRFLDIYILSSHIVHDNLWPWNLCQTDCVLWERESSLQHQDEASQKSQRWEKSFKQTCTRWWLLVICFHACILHEALSRGFLSRRKRALSLRELFNSGWSVTCPSIFDLTWTPIIHRSLLPWSFFHTKCVLWARGSSSQHLNGIPRTRQTGPEEMKLTRSHPTHLVLKKCSGDSVIETAERMQSSEHLQKARRMAVLMKMHPREAFGRTRLASDRFSKPFQADITCAQQERIPCRFQQSNTLSH